MNLICSFFLTLSLFVLRILADDPDNTLALNDFALIANRLYGSSYFHSLLLSSFSAISYGAQAGLHARTNKNSPVRILNSLCIISHDYANSKCFLQSLRMFFIYLSR